MEEAITVLAELHNLKLSECVRLSARDPYYTDMRNHILEDDVGLRKIATDLVDIIKSIRAKEL